MLPKHKKGVQKDPWDPSFRTGLGKRQSLGCP